MFHFVGQDGRPLQLTGRKCKIESTQISHVAFCQQLSDHYMHDLNCMVIASKVCSNNNVTFSCDVFSELLSHVSSECSMRAILKDRVDRFNPCFIEAHALEKMRRF